MSKKWNIIVTVISILIVLLIMSVVALAIHASLGLLDLPYPTESIQVISTRLPL